MQVYRNTRLGIASSCLCIRAHPSEKASERLMETFQCSFHITRSNNLVRLVTLSVFMRSISPNARPAVLVRLHAIRTAHNIAPNEKNFSTVWKSRQKCEFCNKSMRNYNYTHTHKTMCLWRNPTNL